MRIMLSCMSLPIPLRLPLVHVALLVLPCMLQETADDAVAAVEAVMRKEGGAVPFRC